MDSVRLFWILKRIRRSMSYEVVFFFLENHKCIDVNEREIKKAIHDFLCMRSSESVIKKEFITTVFPVSNLFQKSSKMNQFD